MRLILVSREVAIGVGEMGGGAGFFCPANSSNSLFANGLLGLKPLGDFGLLFFYDLDGLTWEPCCSWRALGAFIPNRATSGERLKHPVEQQIVALSDNLSVDQHRNSYTH